MNVSLGFCEGIRTFLFGNRKFLFATPQPNSIDKLKFN